jgi:type III secretion system OrgA/MxiK family protein
MNPAAVLTIMYAPCAYAHPEHRSIAGVDLGRLPGAVANQLLIDHHGFDTRIDFDFSLDHEAKRYIDYWIHLPRICFLMGIQCLRTALVEQARYLRLDPLAQRFLCLPLRPVQAGTRMQEPNDTNVLAAGSACVAAVFRRFPEPLRQRLPLLFPKAFEPHLHDQLNGDPSDCIGWHPSLFSFAVNYALLDYPTAA